MGISKKKPFGTLRYDSQEPLLIKGIFRNPGLSIMRMLIITAGQSYGLIPALSLELLFRPRWNSCSGLPEFMFRLKSLPE